MKVAELRPTTNRIPLILSKLPSPRFNVCQAQSNSVQRSQGRGEGGVKLPRNVNAHPDSQPGVHRVHTCLTEKTHLKTHMEAPSFLIKQTCTLVSTMYVPMPVDPGVGSSFYPVEKV